jgi:uncharacterized protein (DUF1697 family)
MSKYEKLLLKILQGGSDANISFDDLCNLMKNLGFAEVTTFFEKQESLKKSTYSEMTVRQRFIK